MKQPRRDFIKHSGIIATTGLSAMITSDTDENLNPGFIHHVFFWLNNPDSEADRNKLVEGLQKLSKVKTIKKFHIGKPADTHRDVVERGYAISWLVYFKNDADQASYQTDPIHMKFVEDCSHIWSKVIVYDTVAF